MTRPHECAQQGSSIPMMSPIFVEYLLRHRIADTSITSWALLSPLESGADCNRFACLSIPVRMLCLLFCPDVQYLCTCSVSQAFGVDAVIPILVESITNEGFQRDPLRGEAPGSLGFFFISLSLACGLWVEAARARHAEPSISQLVIPSSLVVMFRHLCFGRGCDWALFPSWLLLAVGGGLDTHLGSKHKHQVVGTSMGVDTTLLIGIGARAQAQVNRQFCGP